MENRRPGSSEYDPRYEHYLQLVPETDICGALEQQHETTIAFLRQLPESAVDHRYAPGKWTSREVIGHVLDTERIFGFRLLTFARGDVNPLTRAEENLYVKTGEFGRHPLESWVEEYSLVRRSNVLMARHLPDEAWDRIGTVSGLPITVRAIAYLMLAHERHHLHIIRTRYLQ